MWWTALYKKRITFQFFFSSACHLQNSASLLYWVVHPDLLIVSPYNWKFIITTCSPYNWKFIITTCLKHIGFTHCLNTTHFYVLYVKLFNSTAYSSPPKLFNFDTVVQIQTSYGTKINHYYLNLYLLGPYYNLSALDKFLFINVILSVFYYIQ